jgi:uncharacterized membrane protein (DUF373 family)
MINSIKKFEKLLISTMVFMMAVVLLLSVIELGWVIIKDIISPPLLLLEIDELLELFGIFMLVLIGIELLETIIKTYLEESSDHARIVISVAIIAIARKVIILDAKDLSGMTLLGIAAIILALTVSYYLVRQSNVDLPGPGTK